MKYKDYLESTSTQELRERLVELQAISWGKLSEEEQILKDEIYKFINFSNDSNSEDAILLELSHDIKLTTANSFVSNEVDVEIDIITAECVFGMNVFRDFFAGMTDFFGGRSEASQKILRDARKNCLQELKLEAARIKADGVLGVDLDYSEISGKGKGMLFLVASGTAVKFKK
jgi:uncharacterized protein YbjQ (UPF0145 family)